MSKHLVIFEPNAGGHHGLFIQHLLRYWGEHNVEGILELLVTPRFLETHTQITKLIAAFPDADIRISSFDPLPPIQGGGVRGLVKHDLRQGHILKQKLKAIRPTHALLMYFDHLQVSLGTSLRHLPDVHLAGIYFRPSFHYPILDTPSAPRPRAKERIRKKWQLKLALNNNRLRTLFCLDPYVVPIVQSMSRRTQAVILPDGIERTPLDTQHDAIDWGISPKRTVALCFGSLARRKGVFKLLDALPYLSKATQKQLAIVFAGVVARSERDAFYASMAQMRNETDVQLVVDDRFVADAEVQPMIKRADLILVTYQHHIGSSNVLIRAADAGIPVLGSNYGVIGAQIHDFTLGVAVDTTISKEIAAGLELHVNQKDSINFNKETARRFAASHDAAMYAKTIFSTLGFV